MFCQLCLQQFMYYSLSIYIYMCVFFIPVRYIRLLTGNHLEPFISKQPTLTLRTRRFIFFTCGSICEVFLRQQALNVKAAPTIFLSKRNLASFQFSRSVALMVRQNAPCQILSLWRRNKNKLHLPDVSFIFGRMLSRYKDLFQPIMVLARDSCCKHSQGHRYMWVHIIHIPKKSKKHKRTHDMTYVMYLCECVYIYICTKKVRRVSTRECRDKCELAVHGSNHNVFVVWQIMTNIHLWIHVCIQRASKCERSHGHWWMWVRTTRVRIQRIYDTSSTAQDGGGNFQNRTPIVVSFSLTLMQIHLLIWHVACISLYYVPCGGWRPHQEPSAEKEPRNPRGMQRESFQSPPVAGRCPSLLGEQKLVVWNFIVDQHFDGTAMWGCRNLTCKYWFIPRIWCSHFACCVCMFLICSRSVFLCANGLSTKPPTSWKMRRFPDDNYMLEAKTCTVDDVARAQAKIREEFGSVQSMHIF